MHISTALMVNQAANFPTSFVVQKKKKYIDNMMAIIIIAGALSMCQVSRSSSIEKWLEVSWGTWLRSASLCPALHTDNHHFEFKIMFHHHCLEGICCNCCRGRGCRGCQREHHSPSPPSLLSFFYSSIFIILFVVLFIILILDCGWVGVKRLLLVTIMITMMTIIIILD